MSLDLPSPPEWDAILSASQKNNAKEVQRLIEEEGVPPTHANIVGQTALHIASLWGSTEALQILINNGANTNAQNRIAGMTPLHCAIRGTFQSFHSTHSKRIECIKLLLEAGADPYICDLKGKDANGCIDDLIAEAQLRKLGDIDVEVNELREALRVEKSRLIECVEGRNLEGVRECLDGEVIGREWNKALVCAFDGIKVSIDEDSEIESVVEIIHALLEAECKTDTTENSQSTKDNCLHTLCTIANSATPSTLTNMLPNLSTIAKDLLSHNATITPEIQMMLPDSARKGKLEMIQFLINIIGIDPNFKGRQNMTALHFAARGGKVEVVKWMLDCSNIDVNVLDRAGKKAVDYAVANGKDDVVELLTEFDVK